jgi:tRNA(Ser,Leu) C12 N-acetylase TAN1
LASPDDDSIENAITRVIKKQLLNPYLFAIQKTARGQLFYRVPSYRCHNLRA